MHVSLAGKGVLSDRQQANFVRSLAAKPSKAKFAKIFSPQKSKASAQRTRLSAEKVILDPPSFNSAIKVTEGSLHCACLVRKKGCTFLFLFCEIKA